MSVIHERPNLKAGIIEEFETERITLAAGTYAEGEVIELTAGVYQKIATVGNFFGIVAEPTVINASNTKATVYITGKFNGDALVFTTVTLANLKLPARHLGIIIK
ncbi:MAG: hypothetical protein LBT51_01265 [Fusobacteriaceae bacterium]|jgi:hypothetical protein|nr:hypothetical protein [Fusobacteriaceae bacterium]